MPAARRAVLLLFLVAAAPATRGDDGPACDVVALKDGREIRGEVAEATARTVVVHARRAWVREHLADRVDDWEAKEAASLQHALRQRRDRLEAWRRDRAQAFGNGPAPDRITPWIIAELDRLATLDAATMPLMTIRLSRFDVKAIRQATPAQRGWLRLGWQSGFAGVEEMSTTTLREALEGRGFDVSNPGAVSIESLLPPRMESEIAWLTRRAATEVIQETGLRYVQYQGLLLPDVPPGAGLAGAGIDAIGALRSLVEGRPTDPLGPKRAEVEASGRVGLMLTRLEIAPDLGAVSVEVGLLVRTGPGRWTSAGSRTARMRTDDVPAEAGEALAQDPQVASAFRLVESIGFGQVPPELRRRGLAVGAATRAALGHARHDAERDLQALALPIP